MRTGSVWYGSGMEERVTTSVRFTPEVVARIDAYAKARDWSRNKAITRLVAQALGGIAEGAPLDLDSGPRPTPEKMKVQTTAEARPKKAECDHDLVKDGLQLRCRKCKKTTAEIA